MKNSLKVRPIQEIDFKDLDEYFGLSTVYKKTNEQWVKYLEETQKGIRLAVVAEMDGKTTATPIAREPYAQRQEGQRLVGLVRTMTSTLISSSAFPCLDAMPIPAATNETGQFAIAFDALCAAYPDLFETVMGDADRPWIDEPQGLVNVALLRRLAYNLLTLLRAVTLRSEENRRVPWRRLLTYLRDALITATVASLDAFRSRPPATQ